MASSKIHPLIDRLNIEIGDFVRISLRGGIGEDTRFFIISEINDDHLFIHPGSRPDRLYKLTLHENGWIFESVDEEDDTNWRMYRGNDGKGPLLLSRAESNYLDFIYQDDPSFTDYRLIREHVIDIAREKELEVKELGGKNLKFKVTGGLVGHNYNVSFRAYTKLGALVSYMNWLETLNLKISTKHSADGGMWDQVDPFYFSITSFETIDKMVDEFLDNYGDAVQEIEEDESVIEFPGPLPSSHRSKPARI
jgi:hypothetical protein